MKIGYFVKMQEGNTQKDRQWSDNKPTIFPQETKAGNKRCLFFVIYPLQSPFLNSILYFLSGIIHQEFYIYMPQDITNQEIFHTKYRVSSYQYYYIL